MLSKRHGEILKILDGEGTVTIAALAGRLGVSLETVRRDLRPLAARGTVLKMHGAVGLAGVWGEAPFQRRMRENAEAKQAVARHVAATIRNGETLMMDTGTTTSFLARALVRHERLTVITNSTDAARLLAPLGGNRVFLAGGEMAGESPAALGPAAVAFVAGFSAQHAVISAGAVNAGGVMDYDPAEAEFARTLLARAARRVVATDAAKFARRGLVTVCGFDGFDELVTDRPPPADVGGALAAAGVRLALAG